MSLNELKSEMQKKARALVIVGGFTAIGFASGCGGLEDPDEDRSRDTMQFYDESCSIDNRHEGAYPECDGALDPILVVSPIDSPDVIEPMVCLHSSSITWQAGPGASAEGYLKGWGYGTSTDWQGFYNAAHWETIHGEHWLCASVTPNEGVWRVNMTAPFPECADEDDPNYPGWTCWGDLDSYGMDDPFYTVDSLRRGSLCILVFLTQDPETGEVVFDVMPAPDDCAYTGQ